MRPGPELALAALMLVAAAPPAAAQVQQALRVPAAKVFAADLLPKVPSAFDPTILMMHTPTLRWYDGEGRLQRLQDAASLATGKAAAAGVNQARLPRNASEELRRLGLAAPKDGLPLLVLYASEPCEPCERLAAPSLREAKQRYGDQHRLLRVSLRGD